MLNNPSRYAGIVKTIVVPSLPLVYLLSHNTHIVKTIVVPSLPLVYLLSYNTHIVMVVFIEFTYKTEKSISL